MSFFPTPDPEKLRAAMEANSTFYQMLPSPSPTGPTPGFHTFCDSTAHWQTAGVSNQEPYPAFPQPMSWPLEHHRGLGPDNLPTPMQSCFPQSTFDAHCPTPNAHIVPSPWAPTGRIEQQNECMPSGSSFEEHCYSLPTPLPSSTSWDLLPNTISSFANHFNDSPGRSDCSSSHLSGVDSSPYAHSDGFFHAQNSPYVKVEDSADFHRTRLYSVPGLMTYEPQSVVKPGDIYTSPPLTAIEQSTTASGFPPPPNPEALDTKPVLRPQRPTARRAVSEVTRAVLLEERKKRGYTTHANSTCHCDQCGKLFQRSYNLRAHMETHDPHRDQPHGCLYPGCQRRFVRRTDLERHERSVHLKERKYNCALCLSSFARKDTLRRHADDGCPKRPEVRKRHERVKRESFTSYSR